MKKCIVTLLCIGSLCALSVTAFAVDSDTQYWKDLYGIPEPCYEDYEDKNEYAADWNEWYAGLSDLIIRTTQAEYARQEDAARKEAEESAVPIESIPAKSIEGGDSNNGNSNQSVETNASAKYPLGSYVDPDGAVWSPDGARLSPDIAPDAALVSGQSKEDAFLSGELADPSSPSPVADFNPLAVTADIVEGPPVWYVEDLRPAAAPVTALEGLKALVTSIFGEYTPVMMTSVVTETVGSETHQYLVETVAPGAAGVDYEWLAGVFLFGILLFCLMKLLGGVLK